MNNQPFGFSTVSSPRLNMEKQCQHLRVQVVARQQHMEFVECKDCGEVFEASEYKDMVIEERAQATGTDG